MRVGDALLGRSDLVGRRLLRLGGALGVLARCQLLVICQLDDLHHAAQTCERADEQADDRQRLRSTGGQCRTDAHSGLAGGGCDGDELSPERDQH
jgi:hypothetical protein